MYYSGCYFGRGKVLNLNLVKDRKNINRKCQLTRRVSIDILEAIRKLKIAYLSLKETLNAFLMGLSK